MNIKIVLILIILPSMAFSQNYKRKVFDYDKLGIDTISRCDQRTLENLRTSLVAVQENRSKDAVRVAKKEYAMGRNCPQVFEGYGNSLFRSGDWFGGIEVIEAGIEKFGRVPYLIKKRSEMSLEMAELGTGQKEIDGNSVYKTNSIPYEEEQFREENYLAALNDLEFLVKEYQESEDRYLVARVYQILGKHERSIELFKALSADEKYGSSAIYNLAGNYISLKKYKEAEEEINKLLKTSPREPLLFDKLAEIYKLKNDTLKQHEFAQQSIYYKNIPWFSGLNFSKENKELLEFFWSYDKDGQLKINRLNEISKSGNVDYIVDVCLMILKIHENHDNGLEDKATEILERIGKPGIEKVNLLFQSNVSTCTITNLADIMATVKDEKSWELLKEYLPHIANMPMTLIPPQVPAKMIKFDEDKGIREILAVVKKLLNQETDTKDPLAELNGFSMYVFYGPLAKVNKSKLKEIATELNYSKNELKLLQQKLK